MVKWVESVTRALILVESECFTDRETLHLPPFIVHQLTTHHKNVPANISVISYMERSEANSVRSEVTSVFVGVKSLPGVEQSYSCKERSHFSMKQFHFSCSAIWLMGWSELLSMERSDREFHPSNRNATSLSTQADFPLLFCTTQDQHTNWLTFTRNIWRHVRTRKRAKLLIKHS